LTPIEALDAPLLLFCSDASRHITGATLTVDDGQVL
jgi:NAD(P)-dependent dehydrogenase (short-subunit alcohol dehydrogenase family)